MADPIAALRARRDQLAALFDNLETKRAELDRLNQALAILEPQ